MVSEAVSEPVWGIQIKPMPQPLRPLFEQVAEEGYELVEWRSPTNLGVTQPDSDLVGNPVSAQEIANLSREFDLTIAYHAPQGPDWHFGALPHDEAINRLHSCIDRALSIGATTMTLHLGIIEGERRHESIRAGARAVASVAGRAAGEGVLLCVENVFKDSSFSTVEDCAILFEEAGDGPMMTLDTGHGNLCGTLYGLIERYGERIGFTHVHDNDGTKDQHFVPGNGTIDWQRLTTALDAVYSGPICFELREDATFEMLTSFVITHRKG